MPIDRKALVQRHNPHLTAYDLDAPLSVGNGEFAYTFDCTGLQTFLPTTIGSTPLCTMSQWGFHSYAYEEKLDQSNLVKELFPLQDRTIAYMTEEKNQEALFERLRINPHRLNLARLGFDFLQDPSHIHGIDQILDLYKGIAESSFVYENRTFQVETICHPSMDQLSLNIETSSLEKGDWDLLLSFPYGSHLIDASNWHAEEKHRSHLEKISPSLYRIERSLDDTRYLVDVLLSEDAQLEQKGAHVFAISSPTKDLQISIRFSQTVEDVPPPSFEATKKASQKAWEHFWQTSACVDFSKSTDLRAFELERRVILSRYLTAIQCSGSLPPQETGLTCNSWYGKFHLEMHLLHAAHFPLWGQPQLLQRSLGWYQKILVSARKRAEEQGYAGVRWPKMSDVKGNDSPSSIGPLLCWQQVHPIYYAELLRKVGVSAHDLEAMKEIVFGTADFMADYVQWDELGQRYVLGRPLIPAQENHHPMDVLNPTFELAYWQWGLETAIAWKKRFHEEVPTKWNHVAQNLAMLPVSSDRSVYLAHERCADTYTTFSTDHPSLLFAYALFPSKKVEPSIMSASLDAVLASWDFDGMWGWDFPLMAMTAARLGRRKDAIDLLLMDKKKNTYRSNGHNAQLPNTSLPLYLPGNGALLLCIAMMVGGSGIGFPGDGGWVVESEDFVGCEM